MRKSSSILVSLFLAGCALVRSDPAPPTETPTLPPPGVTSVPAPDPKAAVETYLAAWSREDYDAMYAALSPASRAQVDPQTFSQRYQEFAFQAAVSHVAFELADAIVNPRTAVVRARVTLTSAAIGPLEREIVFSLVREDQGWQIEWGDSLILPELADGGGLLLNLVAPQRGDILDRDGDPLAVPAEIAALWIVPNQVGGEDAEASMLRALERLFRIDSSHIQARYDDIRQFDWRVTLGEVGLAELQAVSGTLAATGGVQWSVYAGRFYPDNGLASHSVGYVAQLQAEQLETYLPLGYPRDAFIGQVGIEAVLEDVLRGVPGGTLFLTNPDGQIVQTLASRESVAAPTVYLTLDDELQAQAERAIAEFTGAVVVLEKDTGAVLAIASSPDFDPNLFDWRNANSSDGLTALFGSPDRPLVNRAASGSYPLGSVFKIITMAAALESGHYTPTTIYNCGSEFRELQGRVLYDWTVEKELPPQGEITLLQGLERSCNPYFYHIGLDLFGRGLTTALTDMAVAFGLGSDTGIEIGEAEGLVPGPETKSARSDQPWGPEDAVDFAIGQSFLQVTPLQAARFAAAVGNGGTLYRPQLVLRIVGANGEVLNEFAPDAAGQLPLSEENLAAIQQAMVRVVREPKGTAQQRFRGLAIDVAGKTGTAQTGDFTDPHAWFVGYTFEGRQGVPDIAIAVVLEFQGEGSEWAAPVFRRIVEAYFFGRPVTLYPWEADFGVRKEPTPTPGPEDETTPSP